MARWPSAKSKDKARRFFSAQPFSPETELKAHQTADLLPGQVPPAPFSLEGKEGEARRFTEDWPGLQICCLGPRLEERVVKVAMESGTEGWA